MEFTILKNGLIYFYSICCHYLLVYILKGTQSSTLKWKNIAGGNFTLRKCPNFNAGSIFFSGTFIRKFFILSEEAE